MTSSFTFKGFIFLLLISVGVQGQAILFGLTNKGDFYNEMGTIFSTNANGKSPGLQYGFYNDGAYPSSILQASNGKLYGMDETFLFEYNPLNTTFSQKIDTESIFGIDLQVYGNLVQSSSNGKIYGTYSSGGVINRGLIYEYNISSNTFLIKYNFDGIIGLNPYGTLLEVNGKLYGMAMNGGFFGAGVLFKYDPLTNIIDKEIDFNGDSLGGFYQSAVNNLILSSNGKIYGVKISGGMNSQGLIFEYDPISHIYTDKFDFPTNVGLGALNGRFPTNIVQTSDGKLYGITLEGGKNHQGVLFEFDTLTNNYSKKVDFDDLQASYPSYLILNTSNGKLYGTTGSGGVNGYGIFFEYDPSSGIATKKLDFSGNNGYVHYDCLIQSQDGKVIGVVYYGGLNNGGVLFQYDPIADTFTELYLFDYGSDGSYPQGSVVYGTDSIFYGTGSRGGNIDKGVLFSFNPHADTYSKIFDFDITVAGANPYGSLIQANDGKLYGMASSGGSNNNGTLYAYDPVAKTFVKTYDFSTLSGANPYGSLFQAPDGLMYGMTTQGGISGYGVLFSYNSTTTGYLKRIDLDSITQGSHPKGSLVLAPNGKLYGLAPSGGSSGAGTMFSYDYIGNTFTNVFNFTTLTGSNPTGSLVLASNNIFYGLSSEGGVNNLGTLFSFNPVGNTFTKIIDFTTITGTNPMGSLRLSSNGKLYGMTNAGGANNLGTVFELDPVTNTFTKTIDFDGSNGANPTYGNLVEICLNPRITTTPQNITACPDTLVQISSGTAGGETFQWYKNGTSITGAVMEVLTVPSAVSGNTFYYCKVANECGTITSLMVTVTGYTYPIVNGGPNQNICIGQAATLSGAGALTYTWTGGITDHTAFAPTVTGAALYTVTGTDAHQCSATDTVTLKVWALPNVSGGPDLNICINDPVSLSGIGALTYTWTGGIMNNVPFTNTMAGINIYTVTGTDNNQCANSSMVTLTVNGPAELILSGNNIICAGASTSLTASGANTYAWSNGLNTPTVSVSPTITTTYVVTGTGSNGCGTHSKISFITVTVNSLPIITISGNSAICSGAFTNLSALGANTYQWSSGSNTTVITVSPTVSTTYQVAGTDANQCSNTAMIIVTVNSPPFLIIIQNTSVCSGFSTNLTVGGANTYTWDTGSIGSTITVSLSSTTAYQVTGTGMNGCSAMAVTTVTVKSLPIITIIGKTSICIGSETTLSASGANTYSWSTNATTTSINVSPGTTTAYTITGTGANGCEVTQAVTIVVNQLPMVSLDLSGINNICDTLSPVPLTGGSPTGGSYWYNNSTITSLNTSKAGTYPIQYRYTDLNGCVNTASGILTSVHCTVPGICERPNAPCHCTNTCPPPFKVYTGLTPNGDGNNDTWIIDSLAVENTVTIVDKWGNEVYRKEHYNNDWNGKQDGKELPSGVYYYMVENDRKRFSGTVSIIR